MSMSDAYKVLESRINWETENRSEPNPRTARTGQVILILVLLFQNLRTE